jgi:hypothetical protein
LRSIIVFGAAAALALGSTAAQARISPAEARRLRPFELSQLVLMLLPSRATTELSWSYRHGAPGLRWGVYDPDNPADGPRSAVARVRVAGRPLYSFLSGRPVEVVWRVRLDGAAGTTVSRPTVIQVTPSDAACYGKQAGPCSFPDRAALFSPPMKAKRLCSYGGENNHSTAYAVSAPGKRPAIVIYVVSTGSSQELSWLEIQPFREAVEVCEGLARLP